MPAQQDDWRPDAKCATIDPDLWFSDNWHDMEKAKDICNTQCPVRNQCRAAGFEREDEQGVWGGLSRPDRIRLRKLAG